MHTPAHFTVVNLGCKVNHVEACEVKRALTMAGLAEANLEAADVIVVNTCTVTGEADKKSRKAVRHALRVNTHATVAVIGCAAALAPDAFTALDARVRVVPRNGLLRAFGLDEAPHDTAVRDQGCACAPEGMHAGRTRAAIKVQDGCAHACTYCIVHIARGAPSSTSWRRVVERARMLSAAGAREIVFSGIDLGSYADDGFDLVDLVRAVLDATEGAEAWPVAGSRIRLSSIEPMSADARLADLLAASDGRVCRHLHLPLQSGSSRVLAEMGRPYTAEGYLGLVERLRRTVPNLSLTTDLICGFPGETEADFQDSLDLARACGFSRMHVFPYSPRAQTPAAARSDQVPAAVRRERAQRARRLASLLREQDFARRVGTAENVLVEPSRAVTESYHEITVPVGAETGELMRVVLSARDRKAG